LSEQAAMQDDDLRISPDGGRPDAAEFADAELMVHALAHFREGGCPLNNSAIKFLRCM
jgi:hypothetical protein